MAWPRTISGQEQIIGMRLVIMYAGETWPLMVIVMSCINDDYIFTPETERNKKQCNINRCLHIFSYPKSIRYHRVTLMVNVTVSERKYYSTVCEGWIRCLCFLETPSSLFEFFRLQLSLVWICHTQANTVDFFLSIYCRAKTEYIFIYGLVQILPRDLKESLYQNYHPNKSVVSRASLTTASTTPKNHRRGRWKSRWEQTQRDNSHPPFHRHEERKTHHNIPTQG